MPSVLSRKVKQSTLNHNLLFPSLAWQNFSASARIKDPAPKLLPSSSIFRAASGCFNSAWNSQPPKKKESESICCWPPMTSTVFLPCKNLKSCDPIQVARASASMFAPSSLMPFFFRSSTERGGFLSKTWIGIEKKHNVNVPPCRTLREKLVSWPFELAKVNTFKMNLMDAMFVSPYCPLAPWTLNFRPDLPDRKHSTLDTKVIIC